CQQYDTDPFTF
nr:immunoglobulin light chain junction region [Macaca mulatta]